MSSTFKSKHPLPFNPNALPRELHRHYISASDAEIKEMLEAVGASSLDDLYSHIPISSRFATPPVLPDELSYQETISTLENIAAENVIAESFIGDALPDYSVTDVVEPVCSIRNLTTAYTPYQPERSQGTLMTHWVYQCMMSQITGFEAINSSLYDRSTAIFEAISTAVRTARKGQTVLISEGIFPQDRVVVETLARETDICIEWVALDSETGLSDVNHFRSRIDALADELVAIIYPQINCLGLLEDVDALNDLLLESKAKTIAVIDPALLGTGGLKSPVNFGEKGADMIVGEAQHLAIRPNFGGPGLGLFGVRYNETERSTIRQTPGRYVGRANDDKGRPCLVMVLSTREQHIRKDKATSNICSNQAFLATIAGASILARGEKGLANCFKLGFEQAHKAAQSLANLDNLSLAFPQSPFVNEFVLKLDNSPSELIESARKQGIHLGVDVSNRIEGQGNLLKISFSDRPADIEKLISFFINSGYKKRNFSSVELLEIPSALRREHPLGLPQFSIQEIIDWYEELGTLNVSPDDGCYPLGSCTMKYNPYINDWAANLPGFTCIHPQAPIADVQGSLHLLYEIQEWFKGITGLPGVTTQPVAGAQGELVGLKLFQAYHADRGDRQRNIILIPASAHGTNFATAAMAGYKTTRIDGQPAGIVLLDANPDGTIDLDALKLKIEAHKDRISGIMITNPNTSGVFETDFKEIAKLVHDAGGLVYMDGANMNAIAGWCDLGAMGVDAVHNNLHKTWTIPHGGGGPGDAFVGVSEKLIPFLPGHQIIKKDGAYFPEKMPKSIGNFHRHWGNFAHKVRAYTYLLRLGQVGVRRMTALAVLSARYCFRKLGEAYPTLPADARSTPRMHEFILTLTKADFDRIEAIGVPKSLAVTRIGKLFLDFGFHAPTVAWPESFGLMIEPTESYSKSELDRFCEAVLSIRQMIIEYPEVLLKVPMFTPVDRVDEVSANRNLVLHEKLNSLPALQPNRFSPSEIANLSIPEIYRKIVETAGLG